MQTKNKKFRIWEKRVHMGAFDFTVIGIRGEYKKSLEFVKWKFDVETDFESLDNGYIPRGKCFFLKGYIPIVWIPCKPKTSREHATLAHECLHAVFHLFEWANLPLTRDTEEVMAHSMSHLITELS